MTDIFLQVVRRTKGHLEEDTYFRPPKLLKSKLSTDQRIVFGIVLELVSEVLAVQNPQLISDVIHAKSSFLSHQAVSTKPSLLSVEYSLLSHQVTPSASPQSVSSSLLSHQASSTHHTLPDLQNVRISPLPSYNPARHHDIPPHAGRRKRMLEDTGESPGKRKMVRLYTEVPSITASCKREREDDDVCLPPAKRLKMCGVSGIILHYSPGTLLHTLPQPSVEWQVVKYQHRQALSDL